MKIPWTGIALAVTLLVMLAGHYRLHLHWILAWLFAVNLTTLLLYGADKIAAVRQFPRVRERTLHFFAFIGGSPAALMAQSLFHHKVSKRKFVLLFWLIVALQIVLFYLVMYTDLLKETFL